MRILSFLFLILVSGCSQKPVVPVETVVDPGQQQVTEIANPSSDIEQEQTIVTQFDPEMTDDEKLANLLQDLCERKDTIGLSGYEGLPGHQGGPVLTYGKYVEIMSPVDLLDAPNVVFDLTGRRVADCGGMPKESEVQEAPAVCALDFTEIGKYFCSATN